MTRSNSIAEATATFARQIEKWTHNTNQFETAIPGVRLSHWTAPTPPTSYTHKSSICLIAQGKNVFCSAKRALLMTRTTS